MSKIEWTDKTWNPVTGCDRISDGCKNCYARKMAQRLHAMGLEKYRNNFEVTCHPFALNQPLKWKKPKNIFVNSMSDLFHYEVSTIFILKIFEVMNNAYWHKFQILTKRSERLLETIYTLPWKDHVWMGVTVEDIGNLDRINSLRMCRAKNKFISFEPLLEDLGEINLDGIDWVIVGGETGPGARPMETEWVLKILQQCKKQNVPFFFKHWGGVRKKKDDHLICGKEFRANPMEGA